VSAQADRTSRLLELHRPGEPLLRVNAWDAGSAISVGGAFAFNALGALVEAATELRDQGTYGFSRRAGEGLKAARAAFGRR
jgi:hypothetical protein